MTKLTPMQKRALFREHPDCVSLSGLLDHKIVLADDHCLRWQKSSLIRWLVREDGAFDTCQIDLNDLYIAFQEGKFTLEAYMKFYMDIGTSLAGFEEVFDAGTRKQAIATMVKYSESWPSSI